jgi:hypothetical protein
LASNEAHLITPNKIGPLPRTRPAALWEKRHYISSEYVLVNSGSSVLSLPSGSSEKSELWGSKCQWPFKSNLSLPFQFHSIVASVTQIHEEKAPQTVDGRNRCLVVAASRSWQELSESLRRSAQDG